MRGNDSYPVYAGTEFVLNISISFSDNDLIDVDIIYTFILSRGNMSSGKQANITVNDDRVTLSTENEMGMASLTYSPIAITDSGWITATVTVSPCNDSFMQPITAASSYSLHVEGKYLKNYMSFVQLSGLHKIRDLTHFRSSRSRSEYIWPHYCHSWRATGVNMYCESSRASYICTLSRVEWRQCGEGG